MMKLKGAYGIKLLLVIVLSVSISVSVLCISLSMVSAATISGSVYNLALDKESDAIIEISTVPKQLFVSKNGDYEFTVKPGNYTLYARTATSESSESVIVNDGGNYTIDIILEEKLTYIPRDLLTNDSNIDVSTNMPDERISITGLIFVIFLLLSISSISIWLLIANRGKNSLKRFSRGKTVHDAAGSDILRHEENTAKDTSETFESMDKYEHQLMHMIRKEKRTTQKDLRKIVPLSEAKVSLIISDLEHKGKIRKFKKGRGNIIIYIKD